MNNDDKFAKFPLSLEIFFRMKNKVNDLRVSRDSKRCEQAKLYLCSSLPFGQGSRVEGRGSRVEGRG